MKIILIMLGNKIRIWIRLIKLQNFKGSLWMLLWALLTPECSKSLLKVHQLKNLPATVSQKIVDKEKIKTIDDLVHKLRIRSVQVDLIILIMELIIPNLIKKQSLLPTTEPSNQAKSPRSKKESNKFLSKSVSKCKTRRAKFIKATTWKTKSLHYIWTTHQSKSLARLYNYLRYQTSFNRITTKTSLPRTPTWLMPSKMDKWNMPETSICKTLWLTKLKMRTNSSKSIQKRKILKICSFTKL